MKNAVKAFLSNAISTKIIFVRWPPNFYFSLGPTKSLSRPAYEMRKCFERRAFVEVKRKMFWYIRRRTFTQNVSCSSRTFRHFFDFFGFGHKFPEQITLISTKITDNHYFSRDRASIESIKIPIKSWSIERKGQTCCVSMWHYSHVG